MSTPDTPCANCGGTGRWNCYAFLCSGGVDCRDGHACKWCAVPAPESPDGRRVSTQVWYESHGGRINPVDHFREWLRNLPDEAYTRVCKTLPLEERGVQVVARALADAYPGSSDAQRLPSDEDVSREPSAGRDSALALVRHVCTESRDCIVCGKRIESAMGVCSKCVTFTNDAGRDSLREQVRALRDETKAAHEQFITDRAFGQKYAYDKVLALLDAQAEPAREPGT